MKNEERCSIHHSPVQLSDSMRERLGVYAIAATAAGVGIAASAQPAEAKIVYTPANEKIIGTVPLDLNHDGITDFKFLGTGRGLGHTYISYLSVMPATSQNTQNKIFGKKDIKFFKRTPQLAAADLTAGFLVGPQQLQSEPAGVKFMAGNYLVLGTTASYSNFAGPWANGGHGVRGRYLGLVFVINGETHFGWARLSVGGPNAVTGLLTGYAYETIPNKPIMTGQTSDDAGAPQAVLAPSDAEAQPQFATLGALALGSSALALWRREEEISGSSAALASN
jgi:hypothetical protein